MEDDLELLRRYADTRCQDAFAEIVRRHLDLVYSVAMRQVCGDAHLAKDVSQKVFTDLARKAKSLSQSTVISGWLYRAARFSAIDVVRSERRRRAREAEAQSMHELHGSCATEADWDKLRPMLDQAISQLNERDRGAVMLRFFEGRSFADIGTRFRLTEDAARMRVERALEKVRALLARRGVTSTNAALVMAVGNQAGIAAPTGVAGAVTGAAIAGATTGGGATVAAILLNFMSTAKMAVGIAGVLALVAIGVAVNKARPVTLNASVEARQSGVGSAANHQESQKMPVDAIASQASPRANDSLAETEKRVGRDSSARLISPPLATSKPPLSDLQIARRDARQEARRLARTRDSAIRRLAPLFEKLSLPPEQKEKLIQLVVDDHESGIDAAAANARLGKDISKDPADYWNATEDLHGRFLDDVRTLLGDVGYSEYLTNDLAVRQSGVIEVLQEKLAPVGEPLTIEQSNQLLSTFRELNTFVVNDKVLMRARDFLSSTQMDALSVVRQRQRAPANKDSVQSAIKKNLPASIGTDGGK